jgi:predicted nucleotidyltransferase
VRYAPFRFSHRLQMICITRWTHIKIYLNSFCMTKIGAMRKRSQQQVQADNAAEVSRKIIILKGLLPDLQRSFGVRSLGIFGSYIRGQQNRKSDIDILVDFDREPTLFAFIRLEKRLSNELGLKVDLVMKNALRPAIGRHILSEVVPV